MGIIYIMLNVPFIWKVKIGVSTWGKLKARRKSVSGSTMGFVFPIWVMILPFGTEKLEKNIHHFCKVFNDPFEKGSGKTEWYLLPAALIAWVIINITAVIYWLPFFAVGWWLLQDKV